MTQDYKRLMAAVQSWQDAVVATAVAFPSGPGRAHHGEIDAHRRAVKAEEAAANELLRVALEVNCDDAA